MSLLEHKHYLNSEDNEEEKEEKELEQPNRELAPWQAPTPSTFSTELKKTKRELTPEEIAEKEEERKSRKKERDCNDRHRYLHFARSYTTPSGYSH